MKIKTDCSLYKDVHEYTKVIKYEWPLQNTQLASISSQPSTETVAALPLKLGSWPQRPGALWCTSIHSRTHRIPPSHISSLCCVSHWGSDSLAQSLRPWAGLFGSVGFHAEREHGGLNPTHQIQHFFWSSKPVKDRNESASTQHSHTHK